ncbi:MAG TPA: DNA-directed RNA polymerase subunit beta' [Pirellulaceae bacterium]|nr:DNA-directed RNA polymerase subunit beta' [Pirellulaceae bacterium]HMO92479.1 DNA-directed RNA polymerase subunit beta' [Pirellulaceae bacterium]HMP67851.1 DNA-directed RNA polymerase subunit beta' [Pirellulaceae bacterium]
MATADISYDRINDYSSVKINLAKPQDIRSWSMGEVKKPETINYRTYRAEKDGLFCERIFGPEKDWECACGKYRGMKYKGMICDRCGVKVTHSRVRRKRMGHIELAAPVVHIWFFKAMPSRLGNLLDMKTSSLEKVIYFQDYVVIDPGSTKFEKYQLLNEEEYRNAKNTHGENSFEAEMGAEAVRKLLVNLDLVQLALDLRKELTETNSKQRKKDITNRLKIVESIRDSDNRPEWMVLDVIPVIPPDLRPLVLLDSGNFATSDLNDLYRRIINRNNRLRKLVDLNAPEVIIRNEKRMLQQSVDALFDNNRCKRPVLGSSNRPLKSLTDMIKGKQGRFRENLLGKRVDYSARSVIVVGPRLRLHQCGLPKKIALELYQPFIIRKLKDKGHADTIKSAKKMLERRDEEVWDILEEVIKNHPVLLNRAPTLHRMGIQAFEPVLVEGNAIHLHPLVCRGFNADFDGDQMAVHLPLSIEAQVEAHTLMMSTNNIFAPSNGKPIMSPSQDTVMGCYYISLAMPGQKGEGMAFYSEDEAEMAFNQGVISTHAKIKLRLGDDRYVRKNEEERSLGGIIETSYGRILFNSILPQGMDFYNYTLRGGDLATVISDCYQKLGRRDTINLLDDMNQLGFRESTRSGLSFATDDLVTPESKTEIVNEAEKVALKYRAVFARGLITEQERYNKVLDTWTHAREKITKDMMSAMEHDDRGGGYVNPVYLMAHSGARGGVEQIRQLAGMRGLMAKPTGEIIETPIKANFREGLNVLEYFSSTHGARKGLADTALKTADSGYLTRKLADVAQNVVVTQHDCGTAQGITKGVIYRGEQVEVRLATAINGRVSRANIVNPVTDEVIVRENEMITPDIARKIEEMGLEKIQVRSPMTCDSQLGVCRLCYGMDMSTGAMVEEGMAVGIIAAQSIGEPGTQLTMRTFHIGGVAGTTTEESEKRCNRAGIVKLTRIRYKTNDKGDTVALGRNGEIAILDPKGRELEVHKVPMGAVLNVKDDQEVKANTVLCQWNPHTIPILAEVSGRVRYEEVIEGETMSVERDPSGTVRKTIIDHKGVMHPQIVVEDQDGKPLDVYYLPERAHIIANEGDYISAGTAIAETPRESSGVGDITGGLPRVTEVFEARKPKDPAVLSEVDGVVEIQIEKKRGKRVIIVRNDAGQEFEHLVPPNKRFLVHSGDVVKAGQSLVDGPLVPHDILRVSSEEALQQYLQHEIQSVYRSQRVEINDKHIEIIVSRMLRKVRIETPGDTELLPGFICDRFDFKRVNDELMKKVKITSRGDSDFIEKTLVLREVFEQTNTEIEALGGTPAKCTKPKMATCSTQLLGITKASVQSSSFISAASFQETTKVLTEAALAGKVDNLVGLKENVILGHLIPAGTGFRTFQESEVHFKLEALDETTDHGGPSLTKSFPLLESAQGSFQPEQQQAANYGGDSMYDQPYGGANMSGGYAADNNGGDTFGLFTGAGDYYGNEQAGNMHVPGPVAGGDDLTLIEGIGPAVAQLLNKHGLYTYVDLAQLGPDQFRSILSSGGSQFAMQDPSTWGDQAKLAAAGEFDRLREWQDQLHGGRVTHGTGNIYEDLTKIEGIGPRIQQLLFSNGICTYQDLSNCSVHFIRGILESEGGSMAMHDPSTWPDQAKLAAVGEWEKLIEWQNQLDGGRVVAHNVDDLTRIEGIGPKIQQLLYANGISSFPALANCTVDYLRDLLATDGNLVVHDPTTWPDQARLAAAGEWDRLVEWQNQLNGGRA